MNHQLRNFKSLLLTITIVSQHCLRAQVLLSGGPYSQDFNALPVSGSASWVDNVTLQGWYASRSVTPNAVTNCHSGPGAGTTGGLYSFGRTGSQDRALGSVASGGTGKLAYGIRFLNDTASALGDFKVSYTGEQWRCANTNPQVLAFGFQVGAALTNADARDELVWGHCPSLDFQAPNVSATQALDGNDPTNRFVFSQVSLSGIVLAPGEELFVRWQDLDDPGYDDGLAIDDFALSFSPIEIRSATVVSNVAFLLMTYNTHGNEVENWSTNSYQVRAIGRQLTALKPDIVALNEIPETNTWQIENWVKAFLPGYSLATNSLGDGSIRNVILSRFPIVRSQSRLHGSDLAPFGCTNNWFKRDLFEAEIAVPDFPQPLHVFAAHLKSGQGTADSDQRAGEAAAISNYLATAFLPAHPWEPYVLCGDMNEDIARPPASHPQSIQRLLAPGTGLQLTSPLNPVTASECTWSIQADAPGKRYDYILPCGLLCESVAGAEVFRSDLLTNTPYLLRTNDDRTASDHLPVLVAFGNPYAKPFRLLSIQVTNSVAKMSSESVPGQSYELAISSDMVSWASTGNPVMATSMSIEFSLSMISNYQFFRIRRAE